MILQNITASSQLAGALLLVIVLGAIMYARRDGMNNPFKKINGSDISEDDNDKVGEPRKDPIKEPSVDIDELVMNICRKQIS